MVALCIDLSVRLGMPDLVMVMRKFRDLSLNLPKCNIFSCLSSGLDSIAKTGGCGLFRVACLNPIVLRP